MSKSEQSVLNAIELRKLKIQNGELKTKCRILEIECDELRGIINSNKNISEDRIVFGKYARIFLCLFLITFIALILKLIL